MWSVDGQSSLIICLKGRRRDDGESARIDRTVHLLQEVSEADPRAFTLPSSRAASPEWLQAPPGGECVSPSAWVAAVFGLTTGLYHARVHVVIQSRKNFPACLEKPETLNGFQGLLMWPVQEIAIRQ